MNEARAREGTGNRQVSVHLQRRVCPGAIFVSICTGRLPAGGTQGSNSEQICVKNQHGQLRLFVVGPAPYNILHTFIYPSFGCGFVSCPCNQKNWRRHGNSSPPKARKSTIHGYRNQACTRTYDHDLGL